MAANASIYSLIRPQQPLPNPLEQYGQAMTIKNLMGQQKMQERAMSDDDALRSAYQDSGGDPVKLKELLYGSGLHKPAMEAEKHIQDKRKTEGEAIKRDDDLMKSFAVSAKEEMKNISSQEQWDAFRDLTVQRAGMLSTQQYRDMAMNKIQAMPAQFDPNYISNILAKQEAATEFMRNAAAAGIKPGTPEFKAAWEKQQSGGRSEYSTPVYDEQGRLLSYDNRNQGKLTIPKNPYDDGPVVGAAQSPGLQGRLAEAKESGKVTGATQTEAKFDLPETIANTEQSIALIDKMIGKPGVSKPHPGFKGYVGWTWTPGMRLVEGSDEAGFEALQKQVTGGVFLEAFDKLKGGGHITEIEGEKATQAKARMNKAQNEQEYMEAAREYQAVLLAGLERAKQRAGVTPSNPSAPSGKPTGKIKFLGFE